MLARLGGRTPFASRYRTTALMLVCLAVMLLIVRPSRRRSTLSSSAPQALGAPSPPPISLVPRLNFVDAAHVYSTPGPQETKRVVAFSLFSHKDKPPRIRDTAGLLMNIAAARQWYPGWTVRAYIAESFNPGYIAVLRDLGAEVITKPDTEAWAGMGMNWRMQAFNDDPSIMRVMSRDADSRLNPREAWATAKWEAAGAACMTLRDHRFHSNVLQGGMWGCTRQTLVHALGPNQDMTSAAEKYWKLRGWEEGSALMYDADQNFLRDRIWPLIAADTLVFCSHFCDIPNSRESIRFPVPWTDEYFVGAYAEWNQLLQCDDAVDDGEKRCKLVEVLVHEIVAAMLALGPGVAPPLDGCSGIDLEHHAGGDESRLTHLQQTCQDTARTLALTMSGWLPGEVPTQSR